jgi:hypothetical protein
MVSGFLCKSNDNETSQQLCDSILRHRIPIPYQYPHSPFFENLLSDLLLRFFQSEAARVFNALRLSPGLLHLSIFGSHRMV